MRSNTWVVAAVIALAGFGCGGGGAEEPSGGEPTGGGETSQYEGPITSTDAEHGKEVFSAKGDDVRVNEAPAKAAEGQHDRETVTRQVRKSG